MIVLITIIIATTVSVAIFTMSKASENETRKIMREQGLNLFIFPKGTETIDFFLVDQTQTFPESYVDSLAKSKTFDAVRHLVGILQVKYPNWKDPNGSLHRIILMGYKDEAIQIHLNRQQPMDYDVKPGEARVGADIAKNIPEGFPFEIQGRDGEIYPFKITERLAEGYGIQDQSVALNLKDLQQVMGMPGQINKIEALECVCHDGRVVNARRQINTILPDLEVKELSTIANAREYQREMMNKYGAFIIPFVLVGCMLITGLLFYQNIKTRQYEFGILKAIGTGNLQIMTLILGKALVLGILGGLAGFWLGSSIASYFGQEIFQFTAQSIRPFWNILIISLWLAPLFSMLATWIPGLLATQIDPATILSKE